MADNNANISPYPFMFDPSQMSDPYGMYNKMALPFMGQMASNTPTDALGNPIQSYTDAKTAHDAWAAANPAPPPVQGTTLNNTGQTYGLQPSDLSGSSALNPSGNQAFGMAQWGGMMSPQAQQAYANAQFASPGQAQGATPMSNQAFQGGGAATPVAGSPSGGMTQAQMLASFTPQQQQWWAGAPANEKAQAMQTYGVGQAPAAAAPAQTNPINMNQAYIAALSNPGKVTTGGANVPQANLPSNQSGVMQAFLQNWQGGGGQTTGAGNYNNAGFINALKGGMNA